MTTRRFWLRILPLFLALALAGCGSSTQIYVNPDADMSFYGRVTIVPFVNVSGEGYAAARITRAFYTELLLSHRFEVVEPGEFDAALDRVGGLPGADGRYDPEKLRTAATNLKATGLIQGSVSEYKLQRVGTGDAPVVTFDVEMRDVATGTLVWRAAISRRGKGRFPIFGGTGTRTFGKLVQSSCHEMVKRLESEAF